MAVVVRVWAMVGRNRADMIIVENCMTAVTTLATRTNVGRAPGGVGGGQQRSPAKTRVVNLTAVHCLIAGQEAGEGGSP